MLGCLVLLFLYLCGGGVWCGLFWVGGVVCGVGVLKCCCGIGMVLCGVGIVGCVVGVIVWCGLKCGLKCCFIIGLVGCGCLLCVWGLFCVVC